MTETDATRRPLTMPETFLPYLEKHRIYKIFKDMLKDLIINLPKDHLKHMKVFVRQHLHSPTEPDRIIMLVSPELKFDKKKLVKEMIKKLGVFVITRRYILDRYEKHDDYKPGCVSPELMSEVTKLLTLRDPVPVVGWLMFDHPCTVREASCLQQDGVLPTVTLVLTPPPPQAPPADNPITPARTFFDQDFEGLKYVYNASLKVVHVEHDDEPEKMATKCFNAIQACMAGAQGPSQAHTVLGAPTVYRIVIIGPRGSGRSTHARLLAEHFGLVLLKFDFLYHEAMAANDDLGDRLRRYGLNMQLKSEIVKRRIDKKDCLDHGWVLTGHPTSGYDFEQMDNMPTPPNRVIFLHVDWVSCKERLMARGLDWCTGTTMPMGSGPRVIRHPDDMDKLDADLDYYFTEALAELRAAAGLTAVAINATDPIDVVQVKIQAAVMAAPAFDIEHSSKLRNVCGD